MQFSNKRRPGFTLIELLMIMAIVAILTAIVFVAFADERERNAVKRGAETVQVIIQEQQNRAQSGITVSGQIPAAFGLSLSRTFINSAPNIPGPDRLLVFADGVSGVAAQGQYNFFTAEYQQTTTLPEYVEIIGLYLSNTNYSRVDLTYVTPNGLVAFNANNGGPWTTQSGPLEIRLKQTRKNICYSVIVQPNFGTVTKREISSAC